MEYKIWKPLVDLWEDMDTVHSLALAGFTLTISLVSRMSLLTTCDNPSYTGPYRYEGDNFVLDQQVVRAALKSYRNLFSSKPPAVASLTPSSAYLRYLVNPPTIPASFSEKDLRDPATSILLLELRAALLVHEHAQNALETDASANQRVSKAVTESFVAAQVGGMINSLSSMSVKDRIVVSKVFLLVSSHNPSFSFLERKTKFFVMLVSSHDRRRRPD